MQCNILYSKYILSVPQKFYQKLMYEHALDHLSAKISLQDHKRDSEQQQQLPAFQKLQLNRKNFQDSRARLLGLNDPCGSLPNQHTLQFCYLPLNIFKSTDSS